MQNTMNQSNVAHIQVVREQLVELLSVNYPMLRSIKVKKKGDRFCIRARYLGRCIKTHAYSIEKAIIYFFRELNRKVFEEPYLPKVA